MNTTNVLLAIIAFHSVFSFFVLETIRADLGLIARAQVALLDQSSKGKD